LGQLPFGPRGAGILDVIAILRAPKPCSKAAIDTHGKRFACALMKLLLPAKGLIVLLRTINPIWP
jgi:hypothetical protein